MPKHLGIEAGFAGEQIQSYHIKETSEEPFEQILDASFGVKTNKRGGGRWSEGTYARAIADEIGLPIQLLRDDNAVRIYGLAQDIAYVKKQLDILGFVQS